jgi:hypothetical protein
VPGSRFNLPAAPTGSDFSSDHLVRIVDPLGDAVAWFAPEAGAACAGFSIRQVKGYFPDQRLMWREIVTGSAIAYVSPLTCPEEIDHGRTSSIWRFVERDPSSCTMDRIIGEGSQTGYLRLVASLGDARLSLSVREVSSGRPPNVTSVRLRLTCTSTPDITLRSGAIHMPQSRPDGVGHEDRDERITVAVESPPSVCTVETDHLGGQPSCTVTYFEPLEGRSIVSNSERHGFTVSIGLQPASQGDGNQP